MPCGEREMKGGKSRKEFTYQRENEIKWKGEMKKGKGEERRKEEGRVRRRRKSLPWN